MLFVLINVYYNCYKCGHKLDDFPSHLCKDCRAKIREENSYCTPEEAIPALAERLDIADLKLLKGLKIRIDKDMLKGA